MLFADQYDGPPAWAGVVTAMDGMARAATMARDFRLSLGIVFS
ncbi:MAG: hypothetical protein ACXWKO_01520 [Phenylobacterium sp.]